MWDFLKEVIKALPDMLGCVVDGTVVLPQELAKPKRLKFETKLEEHGMGRQQFLQMVQQALNGEDDVACMDDLADFDQALAQPCSYFS